MRYEDYYDGYNYDYDELVENTEDLGLDEEPWMNDLEEEDDERKYWTHSQWDAFNKQRAIDTEKQLKKMLGDRYAEPKKV